MSNDCLEIWNVIGDKPACLKIYRNKGRYYLFPFFEHFFRNYDFIVGMNNLDRYEKDEKEAIIRFWTRDFFGAFMWNYKSDELADFLEKRMSMDSPQEEMFIRSIRDFDKEKLKARLFQEDKYDDHFILVPKDFPAQEIENTLSPSQRPKGISGRYFPARMRFRNNITRPYQCTYLERIVEELAQHNPPIIVCTLKKRRPQLNDIDIISKYKISVEHLELRKTA